MTKGNMVKKTLLSCVLILTLAACNSVSGALGVPVGQETADYILHFKKIHTLKSGVDDCFVLGDLLFFQRNQLKGGNVVRFVIAE